MSWPPALPLIAFMRAVRPREWSDTGSSLRIRSQYGNLDRRETRCAGTPEIQGRMPWSKYSRLDRPLRVARKGKSLKITAHMVIPSQLSMMSCFLERLATWWAGLSPDEKENAFRGRRRANRPLMRRQWMNRAGQFGPQLAIWHFWQCPNG
jgi:hypothetical protein